MIELCAVQIDREDKDKIVKWGLDILPSSFSERAMERQNEAARLERMSGMLLLWHILNRGDVGGEVSLGTLEIAERTGGKPYFPYHSHIDFSISHKGGLVVCALSRCDAGCDPMPVGVDVERIFDDEKRAAAIAQRFFSETEKRMITQSKNPCETFARIWTRKESLLKLRGEGIGKLSSADTAEPGEGIGFSEYHASYGDEQYIISLCCRADIKGPCEIDFISF